jgi:hypothetical protein
MEDVETDELMLAVLQAVQDGNQEKMLTLFWEGELPQDKEDLKELLSQMQEYFKGNVESWKKISQNKLTTSEGVRVDCVYLIVTDVDEYYIRAIRIESDGKSLLNTFHISRTAEQAEFLASVAPTGHLSDISRYTGLQWVLLIMSIASHGFVIFSIVRCIRDKIKKKPLFILMMFVQFTLTLTIRSGFHVRFGVTIPINLAGDVILGGQLLYPNGDTITTLLIPLGAIIYWCIRKKLINKAAIAEIAYNPLDNSDNM